MVLFPVTQKGKKQFGNHWWEGVCWNIKLEVIYWMYWSRKAKGQVEGLEQDDSHDSSRDRRLYEGPQWSHCGGGTRRRLLLWDRCWGTSQTRCLLLVCLWVPSLETVTGNYSSVLVSIRLCHTPQQACTNHSQFGVIISLHISPMKKQSPSVSVIWIRLPLRS